MLFQGCVGTDLVVDIEEFTTLPTTIEVSDTFMCTDDPTEGIAYGSTEGLHDSISTDTMFIFTTDTHGFIFMFTDTHMFICMFMAFTESLVLCTCLEVCCYTSLKLKIRNSIFINHLYFFIVHFSCFRGTSFYSI